MSKKIFTVLTSSIVAVTVIGVSPLKSQALTFDFQFDNTPDATVTSPFVGTGTFSFDGDPGNGTFALTSLANFNFSFNVNGNSFTNTALATPVANILARIGTNGSDRFINFGGSGGGPFNGSVDFVNASYLSLQPGFGSLYFSAAGFGTYQGIIRPNVTPVPEPGSILGLLGLSLGVLLAKNKKQAQEHV
ncbi:PEP-CTERM sorting domain-containing protein [Nostoc sp. CENA67]|uniref:PEP-CTERM sorting domain-containing protein n=1 Tax=Amazonocrinis nigriterrae CENA67 TaxID=2794033 RepID=A0A8J7LB28_9NOST|nr:PEP-CTERM sorting domain-containing protein [Amazonocrinis nigriterrae]MBH8565375.1 PEP-CTERM sorting domain-containing protein [Amazonocrinis nigriterrae CENA67]